MIVLPQDYYNSLIRRSKILDDPLLTEEIKTEETKEKIIKQRKNPDEKVQQLINVAHKQRVLKEKRNAAPAEEIVSPPLPLFMPIKKRGRPPKHQQKTHEIQQSGSGEIKKHSLIDIFFDYEPKGKSKKLLHQRLNR